MKTSAFVIALSASLAGSALRAQQGAAPACLASIPDSTLKPVPVFASIDFASPGRALSQPVAALLQAIGHHARRELGEAPGELTDAGGRFTWRDLGGSLEIWSYRDGRISWSIAEPGETWFPSRTGVELLSRALGAARDSGQAAIVWPDTMQADSVRLYVNLIRPRIDPAGKMIAAEANLAIPLFNVLVPRETPVSVTRESRKRFPDSLLRQGVTGTVILDFTVDTNGVADTTTIVDAYPDAREALTKKKRQFYEQFVATARSMIADARYAPATINGCRIRQKVRRPFSWAIAG